MPKFLFRLLVFIFACLPMQGMAYTELEQKRLFDYYFGFHGTIQVLENAAGNVQTALSKQSGGGAKAFLPLVMGRLGHERNSVQNARASLVTPTMDEAVSDFRSWVQGFGSIGRSSVEGAPASISSTGGGFMSGVDYKVNGEITLGASFGFARQNFTFGDISGKNETSVGFVYGQYAKNNFEFNAALGLGWNQMDTQRTLSAFGIGYQFNARQSGVVGVAASELSYRHKMGDAFMRPLIGLSYSNMNVHDFNETSSGGTYSLANPTQTIMQYEANAGLNFGYRKFLSDDFWLSPEATVGVKRLLNEANNNTAYSLFQLGLGNLKYQGYGRYSLEVKQGLPKHGVQAGFKYFW